MVIPMFRYFPKSKYIKSKVKGKNFYDEKYRKYIEDLAFIEWTICNGITGFAHAMRFGSLKTKYRKEYFELLKEIDPNQYKKVLINEKLEKIRKEKEQIKRKIEEHKNIEKTKTWWVKMGGYV